MRTYGRVKNSAGNLVWVEIQQDASGNFEYGYATTLIQVLKLSLGESPFYANYGIPAQRAVIQQVFPDYYVTITQQQFSNFFASLTITKAQLPTPTYNVDIVTTQGTKIQQQVAV
jgi:hypothetical protein